MWFWYSSKIKDHWSKEFILSISWLPWGGSIQWAMEMSLKVPNSTCIWTSGELVRKAGSEYQIHWTRFSGPEALSSTFRVVQAILTYMKVWSPSRNRLAGVLNDGRTRGALTVTSYLNEPYLLEIWFNWSGLRLQCFLQVIPPSPPKRFWCVVRVKNHKVKGWCRSGKGQETGESEGVPRK